MKLQINENKKLRNYLIKNNLTNEILILHELNFFISNYYNKTNYKLNYLNDKMNLFTFIQFFNLTPLQNKIKLLNHLFELSGQKQQIKTN
jgi:hypothetical protein